MSFNMDDWEPKTNLGKEVKAGNITDIDEIFEKGLPIMELEIIDALLPDLEEEVMDVNLVQRMHKSGRKVNFRVIVAVGNKNGYVGLGQGKAREVGPAIRKAVDNAKYNIIKVRRGCGDWGCVCGRQHTVPFKVTGKASSVNVTLRPAPAGVGLGQGKAREVGPAIRKAVDNAKFNIIKVRRGCGDWGCVCGRQHTVPFKVTGKASSVNVTLRPAPAGVGLAIGDVGKTILSLAGIKDVWSQASGQTQTTVNFANAVFEALKEASRMKASEQDLKNMGVIQ